MTRGGQPALISACIITRDEAANLPRCLGSLTGLVDEVVVYDTGSTDATTELARSNGAVVVQGTWPGGFAEARNLATGHCTGTWVLSIDADEELSCPHPMQLRTALASASDELVALQISIDNQIGVGAGTSYSHVANRLFRRRRCQWRGRIHEQLVDLVTGEFASSAYLSEVRLTHWGYLHQAQLGADKIGRNLALARAEVEDPSFGDPGIALVWLGRALVTADRPEEALPVLLQGASTTTNDTARRQGLVAAARTAMRIGRVPLAQQAIDDLRRVSHRKVIVDILQAGVHLSAARYSQALQLLETVTETVRDDDGYEHSPTSVAEWRAAALVGLRRPGEAADVLLRIVRSEGVLVADMDLFVEALERAGRTLDELAAAIAPSMLPIVVAAAIRLDPPRGDRLLEALWRQVGAVFDPKAASVTAAPETVPGNPEAEPAEPGTMVLAGAAMLGQLLAPMDAGRWSKRLRARGLGALCPLLALSANRSVPPGPRILAACSAVDLGDMAVAGALVDAGAQLGHRPIGRVLPVGANPSVGLQLARGAELAQPTVRRAAIKDRIPEVSVVVEAKGGAAEVLGCLEALAATLPGEVPFEVVVVDSGSTDGTATIVDGLSGDVVSVRTVVDVGSVRARNLGAEHARGEIVVFVDSTARPQMGWLPPLLAAFGADRSIAAVAPVLVDLDGQVRCAGYEVTSGAAVPAGAGLHQRPWDHAGASAEVLTSVRYAGQLYTECCADPVQDVDGLTGAVVAVRHGCFDRVGGFDEEYWNGGATLDLCFALRAAGDRVVCQPQASAVVGPAVDLAVTPWAAADPDTVPFADGVGLRWQLRHNQRRFLDKWEVALARR